MDSRNENEKQPDYNREADNQDSAQNQTAISSSNPQREVLKHSGLGIASFTIGLIAILMSISLTIYIFGSLVNFLSGEQFQPDPALMEAEIMRMLENNPFLLAVFPLFLMAGLLHVIGAVLGLIGLFQEGRKKFFSGFGLGLNALPIVGFIFIFLLGLFLA